MKILNSGVTGELPRSPTTVAVWEGPQGKPRPLLVSLACDAVEAVAAHAEIRRATITYGDGSFIKSFDCDLEDGASAVVVGSYCRVEVWTEAAVAGTAWVDGLEVRAQAIISPYNHTHLWRCCYTSQIQVVAAAAYGEWNFDEMSATGRLKRGAWHSVEPIHYASSVGGIMSAGFPAEQVFNQRAITDTYLPFHDLLLVPGTKFRLDPQTYSMFWTNDSDVSVSMAVRLHAGTVVY